MSKKNKLDVAKKFSYKWTDHGDEKQETQKFWLALLREIFEIESPEDFIDFEYPVKIDGTNHFVDAIIRRCVHRDNFSHSNYISQKRHNY